MCVAWCQSWRSFKHAETFLSRALTNNALTCDNAPMTKTQHGFAKCIAEISQSGPDAAFKVRVTRNGSFVESLLFDTLEAAQAHAAKRTR